MFAVIEGLTPHQSAQAQAADQDGRESAPRTRRPVDLARATSHGASCATSAWCSATKSPNRLMAPLQESSAAPMAHAQRLQA